MTKRNIAVYYITTWTSQLASFLMLAILARIQTPEDFGLSSLSYLILSISVRVNEAGINEYYVINGSEDKLNSLYSLNKAKGIIIALCITTTLALFSSDIETYTIIILAALALNISLDGFKNPYIYNEYKKNNILPITYTERLTYLASAIAATTLFILTEYKYTVIIFFVIYSISQLITSFKITEYKRTTTIDKEYINRTLRYVLSIGIFIAISYLLRQGPEFTVKKYFGLAELGVFSFTLLIALAPLNIFVYPITKYLLPRTVEDIKNNEHRLRKITHMFFITILILTGIQYSITPVIINNLDITTFDVQLFEILTPYLASRSMLAYIGMIYKASNHQNRLNAILAFELGTVIALLVFFNTESFYDIAKYILAAQLIACSIAILTNKAVRKSIFPKFTSA